MAEAMVIPRLTVDEAQAVLDRIQWLHCGGVEAGFLIHDTDDGTSLLTMSVAALDARDERLYEDPGTVPEDAWPKNILTMQTVGGYELRDAETLTRCVLGMACQFAAHEAAEWFRVDGEMIYDPHDPDHGNVIVDLPRYPLPRGLI